MHALFYLGLSCVAAFLPGVGPRDYTKGELLDAKVNPLTSVKTQLPFGFYHLPYCHPEKIRPSAEHLGEILAGNRLENSLYRFKMLDSQSCVFACTVTPTAIQRLRLMSLVDDAYLAHLSLDNLPSRNPVSSPGDPLSGFPIGFKKGRGSSTDYFLNNHFKFTVKYHVPNPEASEAKRSYRVVGFEVSGISMIPKITGLTAECPDSPEPLNIKTSSEYPYTYEVAFEESDIVWSSRWQEFIEASARLTQETPTVRWFSILNSLVILLLLSGIVATIIIRTLRRDIAAYNESAGVDEEEADEQGWKLLHGDVFRKPAHSTILVALVGSGVQVLGMTATTVFCLLLGILKPHRQGGVVLTGLMSWVVMGTPAGYVAARLYKLFESPNWKMTVTRAAFLFPGVVFAIFFSLNLVLTFARSSGAVNFFQLLLLVCMWFLGSTPLILLGAKLGYTQSALSLPVAINKIPRQIPALPWYLDPMVACVACGAMPFGAVFTELLVLVTSIWEQRLFLLVGFLFLVLVILIITCLEVGITVTYLYLTSEDYNWWWKSFCCTASSGLYVLSYCVYYYCVKMESTPRAASAIVFFGYATILAFSFSVATGATSFLGSFVFLRVMYGSVKID